MAVPSVPHLHPSRNWLRWGMLAVLALAVLSVLLFLPVQDYARAVLEWIRRLGFWGYVVFIVLYVAATVLFLPGSLLTLGAGFLFGVLRGSVVVSIASVLGATAAFLVGRYLARQAIERKLEGSARFAAMDAAVGREGFKIVLLTRLSPVFPFNLLNYAFGLTRVRLRDYVVGSWIGMIPGTILYVYLGSTARDLTQVLAGHVEGGAGATVLKVVGLAATVIVTLFITRIARRALREAVPESKEE